VGLLKGSRRIMCGEDNDRNAEHGEMADQAIAGSVFQLVIEDCGVGLSLLEPSFGVCAGTERSSDRKAGLDQRILEVDCDDCLVLG
jgi:hypothetical protein